MVFFNGNVVFYLHKEMGDESEVFEIYVVKCFLVIWI